MEAIETGLPAIEKVPFEWATCGGDTVYMAHIPIRSAGSMETGDVSKQAELTFQNLRQAVEAAGGGMANVTQILIYLTDLDDMEKLNEVYKRSFSKPYPNRSTLVVSALAVPKMRLEVVAYAHVPR